MQQSLSENRHTVSGPYIAILLAALTAALISWFAIERYYIYWSVSPEVLMRVRMGHRDIALLEQFQSEKYWTSLRNSAIAIGFFGMLMGGLMGTCEGVSRRCRTRIVKGMLIGLFCGLILGAIGGASGQALYRQLKTRHEDPMYKTILVHLTAWVPVACAVGVGICAHSHHWKAVVQTICGAIGGALLAAMLYSPLAGLIFPTMPSEMLVPYGANNRLMWMLLTGGMIGLFTTIAGKRVTLTDP